MNKNQKLVVDTLRAEYKEKCAHSVRPSVTCKFKVFRTDTEDNIDVFVYMQWSRLNTDMTGVDKFSKLVKIDPAGFEHNMDEVYSSDIDKHEFAEMHKTIEE